MVTIQMRCLYTNQQKSREGNLAVKQKSIKVLNGLEKYFLKEFFCELFHKVFMCYPKARGLETEVKAVLILSF